MRAFRFELTKVQVPAIRERAVSQLVNVDADLAKQVADGLGIPVPKAQPAVRPRNLKPEVKASPTLSLLARPGDGSIRTRNIALLVASGVDGESLELLHAALSAEGAVPRYVGLRLGTAKTVSGEDIEVEVTLETAPSVVFDAVIIPDGDAGVRLLSAAGQAVEFIKDQFRHCKTILALGAGEQLLAAARILAASEKGSDDPGLLRIATAGEAAPKFVAAIARHRHFERQTDPPMV